MLLMTFCLSVSLHPCQLKKTNSIIFCIDNTLKLHIFIKNPQKYLVYKINLFIFASD